MSITNETLLNPNTKVRIIIPERSLEYFENHIIPYINFIGNVISVRGYTCTIRIVSGDSQIFLPTHKDCLEVIN